MITQATTAAAASPTQISLRVDNPLLIHCCHGCTFGGRNSGVVSAPRTQAAASATVGDAARSAGRDLSKLALEAFSETSTVRPMAASRGEISCTNWRVI